MRHLFRPVSIVALAVALVGLIVSQPAVTVLGIAVWLGYVAFSTIKESGANKHDSELSSEGRALVRPIKELRAQIAKIVDSYSDRPEITVIGKEALIEADALIEHTGKLIVVYDQITSSLRGRSEAEHDIKEIAKKIEGTEDGQLKDALVSSAVARQNEINQYKASEETKVRIVAKVKLAEVALYEIKSKLSAGAIGAEPDDLQQDELAGMVSRLKSLSASFDEAEEMVKDRIQ